MHGRGGGADMLFPEGADASQCGGTSDGLGIVMHVATVSQAETGEIHDG